MNILSEQMAFIIIFSHFVPMIFGMISYFASSYLSKKELYDMYERFFENYKKEVASSLLPTSLLSILFLE